MRCSQVIKTGEVVEVIGMASEDDCEHEIFVTIRWEKRKFGVPLSQMACTKVSKETKEAVGVL